MNKSMSGRNYNSQEEETMNFGHKLVFGGVGVAVGLVVLFFALLRWVQVEGNERLVTQNWRTGVSEEIIGPGTKFYMPLTTTVYKYNVGTEKFIMGNKNLYNGEGSDYVDYPAFTITTGGSGKEQPATFSVTLQYNLSPSKLVNLHNTAQNNYEDLIIKPALTRIISDQATQLEVLDFYSGEGRVNLQKNIEVAITEHAALADAGIIVNTFVIDDIALDNEYVEKIRGRQIAVQDKLKSIEEAAAAREQAKKVEAQAEADKLKRIVEAEASKAEKVKAAEAANESQILAAQAAAQQKRLNAEADRFSKEQDAEGLLAQGLAQAKVDEAKRDALYSGQSGERRALVEMERARVELFKNMSLQGIVTEKTVLTMINGDRPQLTVPAVSGK